MSKQVAKKQDKPRLIQGVILKCVDGHWADFDGLTPASELLVLGTTRALQCRGDGEVLDEIIEVPGGEPLPDVDELNEQIPENEWRPGLDGNPRPPWQLHYVAYLLDPKSASMYTYLNSTIGARIAIERLNSKFSWMRALRGENVAPIVKLDSRPMKTSFGMKMRPEFTILEWREFDVRIGITPTPMKQIESKPIESNDNKKPDTVIGKPAKPPSGKEITDGDEIPF
jgi:hypothetical protein